MEMKSRRLEISVADFRKAFEAEPKATFNRTFEQNSEPVAKKIAQGEFFRFWARHGINHNYFSKWNSKFEYLIYSFNGENIPPMIANKNQHTVNFQKMDGTTLSSIQDINQVGNKEPQFKNSNRINSLDEIIFSNLK